MVINYSVAHLAKLISKFGNGDWIDDVGLLRLTDV